ncbi:hypothetical protein AVEN_13468-1 [Araneus ventricosus]|uniref:Uncharacterized protein n=1 Tax=Araneus ventricosus TaxID=182803 RepID=A0A4Y2IV35_ARAVE|nr:hypothetical protein AVEN_13468-1 [Araneus ventricosus]
MTRSSRSFSEFFLSAARLGWTDERKPQRSWNKSVRPRIFGRFPCLLPLTTKDPRRKDPLLHFSAHPPCCAPASLQDGSVRPLGLLWATISFGCSFPFPRWKLSSFFKREDFLLFFCCCCCRPFLSSFSGERSVRGCRSSFYLFSGEGGRAHSGGWMEDERVGVLHFRLKIDRFGD